MKNFIVSVCASVALVFGAFASASAFEMSQLEGVYVTPKVGIGYVKLDDMHSTTNNIYSHDEDGPVVAGLTVGYDFSKKFDVPVRADLEYLYRGNVRFEPVAGHSKKHEANAILANASYDFKECPVVTPYITAGMGTAWLNDGTTNFAYTFGGGVYYDLTDHVAFDFSVRYIDYGDYEKYAYKMDEKGANIMFGVRYTF